MNLQEQISRMKSMMGVLNEGWKFDVKVPIKDILKVNSDGQTLEDALINVKDGLTSKSDGNVLLYKKGDKYEVGDGFHRIAEKILIGGKYIKADVKY